jgi:hypothetical protein
MPLPFCSVYLSSSLSPCTSSTGKGPFCESGPPSPSSSPRRVPSWMSAAAVYPGCLQAQGPVLSHDLSKISEFGKTWAVDRTVSLAPSRHTQEGPALRATGRDQPRTRGKAVWPILLSDLGWESVVCVRYRSRWPGFLALDMFVRS